MSGKPSSEGVTLFLSASGRMQKAQDRIHVLTGEINYRSTELKNQEEEYRNAKDQAFKLLEEMDVKSSHNAGYEGRASWFFAEIFRQSRLG